jgi:hypothetical protein
LTSGTLGNVSIAVDLEQLRATIDTLERAPYLLTVSDDGRAHSVAVAWQWHDDEITCAVGNRTLANARQRPEVSLLWAPNDADGYSLIVDATVTAASGDGGDDNLVRLQPTRAVLHRPAPEGATLAPGCGADCIPLTPR